MKIALLSSILLVAAGCAINSTPSAPKLATIPSPKIIEARDRKVALSPEQMKRIRDALGALKERAPFQIFAEKFNDGSLTAAEADQVLEQIDRVPKLSAEARAAAEALRSGMVDASEASRRRQMLDELQTSFEQMSGNARTNLQSLQATADKYSRFNLGVGAVGVGSAIAAAGLVAASPANVVWVTVFTGISSGALGFQTKTAMEGMSRESIQSVHVDLTAKAQAAQARFATDLAGALAAINERDSVFFTAYGKALENFYTMMGVAYFTPLAVADAGRVKQLEDEQQRLKEELDRLKNPPAQ